jgi:hypothetical protein
MVQQRKVRLDPAGLGSSVGPADFQSKRSKKAVRQPSNRYAEYEPVDV